MLQQIGYMQLNTRLQLRLIKTLTKRGSFIAFTRYVWNLEKDFVAATLGDRFNHAVKSQEDTFHFRNGSLHNCSRSFDYSRERFANPSRRRANRKTQELFNLASADISG